MTTTLSGINGEHTDNVLGSELGLDPDEIQQLRKEGIVA